MSGSSRPYVVPWTRIGRPVASSNAAPYRARPSGPAVTSVESMSQRISRLRASATCAGLAGSVLVHDHAPDVPAVQQVSVALVDLVQAVAPGDQLVDLQVPRAVQAEHLRDVVQGVGGAEERALD